LNDAKDRPDKTASGARSNKTDAKAAQLFSNSSFLLFRERSIRMLERFFPGPVLSLTGENAASSRGRITPPTLGIPHKTKQQTNPLRLGIYRRVVIEEIIDDRRRVFVRLKPSSQLSEKREQDTRFFRYGHTAADKNRLYRAEI